MYYDDAQRARSENRDELNRMQREVSYDTSEQLSAETLYIFPID